MDKLLYDARLPLYRDSLEELFLMTDRPCGSIIMDRCKANVSSLYEERDFRLSVHRGDSRAPIRQRTKCLGKMSMELFLLLLVLNVFRQCHTATLRETTDSSDPPTDVDVGGRREEIESIQDEESREILGRWRNNGEALEPKWRDGDSVPSLPLSHYSEWRLRKNGATARTGADGESRIGAINFGDRRERVGQSRVQQRTGNARSDPSVASNVQHESAGDEGGSSRRKAALPRYRQVLPLDSNEHDYELNDEEYTKPRPRKRRPPQNYEFALAKNEAALRAGSENYRVLAGTSPSIAEQSPGGPFDKALQLKSLLKMQQQEGLSLSEILQRRNLTLSDLLKGEADVISALRAKDMDELDEDIEEVSRAMSNSLTKLSASRSAKEKAATSPTGSPAAKHTTRDPDGVRRVTTTTTFNIVVAPPRFQPKKPDIRENDENVPPTATRASVLLPQLANSTVQSFLLSSNEIGLVESTGSSAASSSSTKESLARERDREGLPAVGGTKLETSTYAALPTIVTTTAIPQPLEETLDSSEIFVNEETNARSENNPKVKLTSLDEDEIMEFSDFPVYRKVKDVVVESSATASPSTPEHDLEDFATDPDEERLLQQRNQQEDTGSTLSIEHILSPTEQPRNHSTKKIDEDNGRREDKSIAIHVAEHSIDYNTFSEAEYQDDSPRVGMKGEILHSTSGLAEETKALDEETVVENLHRHASSAENERYLPDGRRTSGKPYEEIVSEIEPEARAEIFELFASNSSVERLERLLKSRNMSLDELIALRQRGSSKVHLAEVSRLRDEKSQAPEDLGNVDAAADAANVDDKTEEVSSEMRTTSTIDSTTLQLGDQPLGEDDRFVSELIDRFQDGQKDRRKNKKYPDESVEIIDLLTTFASLPFDKNTPRNGSKFPHYSDFSANFNSDSSHLPIVFIERATPKPDDQGSTVMRSGYVERVAKDVECFRGNCMAEESNKGNERKSASRVKPSIIASGAILGVTIVVFLAIFIACRVRQKQKYMYSNTFSRAVFQGPAMAARKLSNSSSLSTVMVNVVATSTAKRPDRNDGREAIDHYQAKSDIDNDSLDANDSWETIPDYLKSIT
ncbi:uncharacterized protein [Prorops nasuta]|uniref:uncharacterized protein n=1 Tax=Prorops nasuta TaxID=863751 RepID=UPI0034CEBAEE